MRFRKDNVVGKDVVDDAHHACVVLFMHSKRLRVDSATLRKAVGAGYPTFIYLYAPSNFV